MTIMLPSGSSKDFSRAERLGSLLHLLLKVDSDKAEALLDVTDNFALGGGGERVTTLSENLHEVVGQDHVQQDQDG